MHLTKLRESRFIHFKHNVVKLNGVINLFAIYCFSVPLRKVNKTSSLLTGGLRQQSLEWKYRELSDPVSASPEPLVNYLDVSHMFRVSKIYDDPLLLCNCFDDPYVLNWCPLFNQQ